jgi:hypothetical protein
VPRFCRHGRFIERCPICRETVPGLAPVKPPEGARAARSRRAGSRAAAGSGVRGGARKGVRVYSDGAPRGQDDGYRNELVPGLRGSADAQRLAEEIAFAAARLAILEQAPPGLYGEMQRQSSWERATWMCFLTAYLSPLEGDDPFRGIRMVLEGGPADVPGAEDELPDLSDIPLGPRTSHNPARGAETLRTYLQWAARAGSQVSALSGDPHWSEERRFQRLFERLALPGFGRMGRYDMLVTLGHLSLYELRADSLHFADGGGDDLATLAAKRLFGIGDPLILERRAALLAQAASVPLAALDLALANWGAGERASVGVPADVGDAAVLERAQNALGL